MSPTPHKKDTSLNKQKTSGKMALEALDTADRILKAATKLFSEKGFDGTSTKEICDAAEANIAAIHYHFESKEGLLNDILQRFGMEKIGTAERTLQPAKNAEEFRVRLQMFLVEMVESFLQQPEIPRIIQREFALRPAQHRELFQNTFFRLFETLNRYVTDGKKKGFVSEHVEPKFASQLLFSQIRQWNLLDDEGRKYFGINMSDPMSRAKLADNILYIFLNGIVEK